MPILNFKIATVTGILICITFLTGCKKWECSDKSAKFSCGTVEYCISDGEYKWIYNGEEIPCEDFGCKEGLFQLYTSMMIDGCEDIKDIEKEQVLKVLNEYKLTKSCAALSKP